MTIYYKHQDGLKARDKQHNCIYILIMGTNIPPETLRNVGDLPAWHCLVDMPIEQIC